MSAPSLNLIGVSASRNADGKMTIFTLNWNTVPPTLGISDGWTRLDDGSANSLSFWLKRYRTTWEFVGGKYVEVAVPPDWFEQKCAEAHCQWFVPFAKRMAEGEAVSLQEIESAYRRHHDGKDIPRGTWGELWERHGKKA